MNGGMFGGPTGRRDAVHAVERDTPSLCRASRQFAGSIAEDDASYVRAYLDALNSAVEVRHAAAGTTGRHTIPRRSRTSPLLLSDPVFAANAHRLYSSPQATAIPQATTNDHTFAGCVGLRVGDRAFTGVVAGRNVVLTAARSVSWSSDIQVILGTNASAPVLAVPVRRVLLYPNYDAESDEHDIALLLLEQDLPRGLPHTIASTETIDAATSLRIVGFGHAEPGASVEPGLKRYVDVPVAAARWAESEQPLSDHRGAGEFVTGKPALDRDGCAVDTGAPCYVRTGSTWHVAGIISRPLSGFSMPCGNGLVGVRLDQYLSWMRSVPGGKW